MVVFVYINKDNVRITRIRSLEILYMTFFDIYLECRTTRKWT